MTGRLTFILLLAFVAGIGQPVFAADTAPTVPDLKHLDTLVRDSGLLAEVFDSHPDAVARCDATSTPGVYLVKYLSAQQLVGWAKVRDDAVLSAGKGAPVEEPSPPPSPAPPNAVVPVPAGPASPGPAPVVAVPVPAAVAPVPPPQVQPPAHDLFWWLNELLPRYRHTALLCLAVLITVLVAFDLSTFLRARNLDLLSLFIIPAASLAAILNYDSPHNLLRLIAWAVILLATLWLLTRALLIGYSKSPRPPFNPNLPTVALVILLVLAGLVHLERILRQDVGASGIWSVRGAQHILSRGELPYGKLGPGDAYGPVVYLIEIPAVIAFPPAYVDARSGLVSPWNPATEAQLRTITQLKKQLLNVPPEKERATDRITLREQLVQLETGINQLPQAKSLVLTSARVTAAVLDALIILGIVFIGIRYSDLRIGLTAAIIYALLPFTVNHLAHVASLVPVAFTVWAVVFLGSPIVAGLLIALGAAACFFPAFLFPLWLAYYIHKGGSLRFTLAFGLVVVAFLLGIWFYTDNWTAVQLRESQWPQIEAQLQKTESDLKAAPPGSDQAAALQDLRSDLNEQLQSLKRPYFSLSFVLGGIIHPPQDLASENSRLFGFWGQLRAAGFSLDFFRPLLMFLCFIFYIALFFFPGHREPLPLISLTAAVLLSTQLWRPVAGGLDARYAPLLVLSFLLYEKVGKELQPEKFVPLQDVRPVEPPKSAVEEIDAIISRGGRIPPPRKK